MSLYQYLRKSNMNKSADQEQQTYQDIRYGYLTGEEDTLNKRHSLVYPYFLEPDRYPYYEIPKDCFNPRCAYLSSEGYSHCDTEKDYSNPKYVDQRIYPPTFIQYNINIDEQQLHDYIVELLNKQNEELVDEIMNIVLERTKNQIDTSVQESIIQAFSEIGIISEEEINNIIENT